MVDRHLFRKLFIFSKIILLGREANEVSGDLNVLGLCLILLNGDYVLNNPFDIELSDVLSEPPSLQLSITQNVFYVQKKEAWRACLNFVSLGNLNQEFLDREYKSLVHIESLLLEPQLELWGHSLNYSALVNDWVKRVSHFMWYCWINETQQISFRFRWIVEDLLRDIYKANHFFILLFIVYLDLTLLHLEELEFGKEFRVDFSHAAQVFYDMVDVLWNALHILR